MNSPSLRGLFTLYGLSLGMTADYTTTGGVQARADGGTLNDAYRYLWTGRDTSNLISRLSLVTQPTADHPGRLIRFTTGTWNGSVGMLGMMIYENPNSTSGVVLGTAIRDLAIRSPLPGGVGILIGSVIDVTFDRVTCYGGYHGIAGYYVGANYDITLQGCSLQGSDAWYVGMAQIIRCDGLPRAFVGGAAVRLSGCDARFGPIETGGYTRPNGRTIELLDQVQYGASYSFKGIEIDQEVAPAGIAVYCEKHRVGGTYLRLQDIFAGFNEGITPIVKLVDHFPTGGAGGIGFGHLWLRGVQTSTALIVETENDWRGTIEDCDADFTNLTQYVKSNSPTVGVVSIHYLDDLPNNLSLARGAVGPRGPISSTALTRHRAVGPERSAPVAARSAARRRPHGRRSTRSPEHPQWDSSQVRASGGSEMSPAGLNAPRCPLREAH